MPKFQSLRFIAFNEMDDSFLHQARVTFVQTVADLVWRQGSPVVGRLSMATSSREKTVNHLDESKGSTPMTWETSMSASLTGWWFGTFFIFPYIGNNHPNWLIFFRVGETTNQMMLRCKYPATFFGVPAGNQPCLPEKNPSFSYLVRWFTIEAPVIGLSHLFYVLTGFP